MRTQTFHCKGHGEFEIDLERNQEPPIWCPIYKEGTNVPCGTKLTKKYSVPAIAFQGSGFYKTDNKEK